MAMGDTEIVELFLNRDERAIEATAEKYENYCSSIAVNILENWEDAEECVSDTYLKAWNCIPPNRPFALRIFWGKITRNLAFDRYKKRNAARRGDGITAMVLEELAECVPGGNRGTVQGCSQCGV